MSHNTNEARASFQELTFTLLTRKVAFHIIRSYTEFLIQRRHP